MGTSRTIILLCVALLLVSSFSIVVVEARAINYGPIREGNHNHRCKGAQCEGVPVNPYNRGCEKPEKCRSREKDGGDEKNKGKIITDN